MKKYFVVLLFVVFCKLAFNQELDWFKNEPYGIIRDSKTLNYQNLTFKVKMVNDSLGYNLGSYLEVYEDYDSATAYNYPALVLKEYAFDLFDIEPQEFKNKEVFKPGYTINKKAIIIARSHSHGASDVGIFFHIFQVDPLLYLGEIERFWWEHGHDENYFMKTLNDMLK